MLFRIWIVVPIPWHGWSWDSFHHPLVGNQPMKLLTPLGGLRVLCTGVCLVLGALSLVSGLYLQGVIWLVGMLWFALAD